MRTPTGTTGLHQLVACFATQMRARRNAALAVGRGDDRRPGAAVRIGERTAGERQVGERRERDDRPSSTSLRPTIQGFRASRATLGGRGPSADATLQLVSITTVSAERATSRPRPAWLTFATAVTPCRSPRLTLLATCAVSLVHVHVDNTPPGSGRARDLGRHGMATNERLHELRGRTPRTRQHQSRARTGSCALPRRCMPLERPARSGRTSVSSRTFPCRDRVSFDSTCGSRMRQETSARRTPPLSVPLAIRPRSTPARVRGT